MGTERETKLKNLPESLQNCVNSVEARFSSAWVESLPNNTLENGEELLAGKPNNCFYYFPATWLIKIDRTDLAENYVEIPPSFIKTWLADVGFSQERKDLDLDQKLHEELEIYPNPKLFMTRNYTNIKSVPAEGRPHEQNPKNAKSGKVTSESRDTGYLNFDPGAYPRDLIDTYPAGQVIHCFGEITVPSLMKAYLVNSKDQHLIDIGNMMDDYETWFLAENKNDGAVGWVNSKDLVPVSNEDILTNYETAYLRSNVMLEDEPSGIRPVDIINNPNGIHSGSRIYVREEQGTMHALLPNSDRGLGEIVVDRSLLTIGEREFSRDLIIEEMLSMVGTNISWRGAPVCMPNSQEFQFGLPDCMQLPLGIINKYLKVNLSPWIDLESEEYADVVEILDLNKADVQEILADLNSGEKTIGELSEHNDDIFIVVYGGSSTLKNLEARRQMRIIPHVAMMITKDMLPEARKREFEHILGEVLLIHSTFGPRSFIYGEQKYFISANLPRNELTQVRVTGLDSYNPNFRPHQRILETVSQIAKTEEVTPTELFDNSQKIGAILRINGN